MGIMNKMKTVKIRDLSWTMAISGDKRYFFTVPSGVMPQRATTIPPIAYCEGYRTVTQSGTWYNMDLSNAGSRIYFIRTDITSVADFLASEGDKILTYETVDSVEEKIINSMATVELGEASWSRALVGNIYVFYIGPLYTAKLLGAISIEGYGKPPTTAIREMPNKTAMIANTQVYPVLYIRDDSYTDAASFKQAMQGKILTYQTITDTTEEII